jgi:hypothetical protein
MVTFLAGAGVLLVAGDLLIAFRWRIGSRQALRNVSLSLEWQNDYSLSH